MIYELRTYELMPGKAAPVLERFEKVTSRLFEKHDMKNVGYWLPVIAESNNMFTYMLAYRSMAHRDEAWNAYMQDPERIRVMAEAEASGPQVHRFSNMLLRPTPYSPDPLGEAVRGGRKAVCELRVYSIGPGKAQVLHDRFAKETLPLFAKHGMTNIGYWTPVVGGYSNDLYYLLGYPSLAQRETAWAGFTSDPEWQAVSRASADKHGVLVENITNIILRPTAFSPLR